jgi:hypothetical protein
MNNFQRVGSVSNAHVGSEFEEQALFYLNLRTLYLISHSFYQLA